MPTPIQPPNTNQAIYGNFPRANLLGGTVVDFSATAGWGNQTTLVNLTIVEDPSNGDDFLLKEGNVFYDGGQYIGSPTSFSYSGFQFTGLLKATDQVNDFNGNPTFKAVLCSPIEVLDATQVVLAGYVGPTNNSLYPSSGLFNVGNLLNVFGWAEQGGNNFGGSQSTDIGLPWPIISNGIQTLSALPYNGQDPATNYGSQINYKNNYYRIDLAGLPSPPSFYRLGGAVNMTLMELLNKYFEDAGCDYLVNLALGSPNVISFTAVPRFEQQQLGKIPLYISQQQNVSNVSRGQELRSDITQTFLVGGSINSLQPLTNTNGANLIIQPFWGFDINGNPIIGAKPDSTQYADDDYQMVLNGSAVADILGELGIGVNYQSCILEMRCALGGFDSWMAYIKQFQPNIAAALQLYGGFDSVYAPNAQTISDLISDESGLASQLGDMFGNNHWPAVSQRLYEFVRETADTYYGKKFLVQLPFGLQVKIDPFTFETSFNDEIADAGYLPEGSNILGLNYINENFFLDQTGRFYPFVRLGFTNTFNAIVGVNNGGTLLTNNSNNITMVVSPRAVNANTSHLKGSAAVVQPDNVFANASVYVRCEQGEASPVLQGGFVSGGSQIVFVKNATGTVVPAVVITIPDAIWAQADDITGNLSDVAALFGINAVDVLTNDGQFLTLTPAQVLLKMLSLRSTSVDFVIHPPAIYPDGVAIATKSNQFTYGPWGQFSANGKLEFEQDDGLVPWNYGGYDLMNVAAIAKLNTIAKGNQVLERGNWTEAGLPKASLGQYLVQDGPILTDVSCTIGIQGVTTNYAMQTFVNRAGAFIFENMIRLQTMGKIYQQLRRTMRQLIISTNDQYSIYNTAYAGFMHGTTYAVQQHTPHAVIGANLFYGSGGNYIPSSFTETYQESVALIGANNNITFNSSACVGLEAIFRPYTMISGSMGYYISPYLMPDSGYDTSKLITSSGLNPLQAGCDINWISSGQNYQGLKAVKGSVDWTTARSLAMRGPMIIQGWGYDIDNNPVPNSANLINYASGLQIPNPYNKLQDQSTKFYNNYLQQSIYWPTGPLDLRWNKFTGTWGSLGMNLCGEISGVPLSPGGTTNMILYVNSKPSNETMTIGCHFLKFSAIPTGVRVMVAYDPLSNMWKVNAADCFQSV